MQKGSAMVQHPYSVRTDLLLLGIFCTISVAFWYHVWQGNEPWVGLLLLPMCWAFYAWKSNADPLPEHLQQEPARLPPQRGDLLWLGRAIGLAVPQSSTAAGDATPSSGPLDISSERQCELVATLWDVAFYRLALRWQVLPPGGYILLLRGVDNAVLRSPDGGTVIVPHWQLA